ncbi:hypothetical protein PIIN_05310 [Serendipita indica DSM 11827]|uniref:Uncharacterized protein n=1 Tax=Serendipita indica (strain DSM 11827) TaxID=1109443 RepID=G4TJ77_SERID|nr:hypothetical protein PIIN_05310 [Serendipita indica DSM 11827]
MAANLDSSPTTIHNDSLSFRRVKPLPKRRRTAGAGTRTGYDQAEINSFSFHEPQALAALADVQARPYFSPLSAQQAIRELFTNDSPDPRILADFTGLYANPTSPPYRTTAHHEDEREEPLEGEYVDHFQLPSNTKKRKVPGINHSTAFGASEPVGLGLGTTQQHTENVSEEGATSSPTQRYRENSMDDSEATLAPNKSILPLRAAKNQRQSLITRAGLRRKALINSRRKQFFSVLEELPECDPLAIELALAARYPQLDLLFDSGPRDPLRNSRRSNPKSSISVSSAASDEAAPKAPSGRFTFTHPCSSSNRMIVIKAEAERCQLLFAKELELHTERAIVAAEKVAATAEPPAKSRKRAAPTNQPNLALAPRLDSDSLSGDQSLFGKNRQKKKKRSALANASNPHHLRNYVPSRLPQQAPPMTQASLAAANFLSPPPLRFLSAQIPPRRRKRDMTRSVALSATLVSPIDEWICATCEYSLFYGDENAFRKAVRNRKRILLRRRKARERAAAAAGTIAPAIPDKSANIEHPDIDLPIRDVPLAATAQPRVRRQVAGADVSDTLK